MKVIPFLTALVLLLVPAAAAFNQATAENPTPDGAVVWSSNRSENVATWMATTYTIDAGVTVTLSGIIGINIYATEKIEINGILDASGKGGSAGALGTSGSNGLGLGGSGATSSTGAAGGLKAAGSGGGANTRYLAIQHLGSSTAADYTGPGGGGGQTGTGGITRFGGGGGGGGACGAGGNGGSGGATAATGGTGGIGGAGGGFIHLFAPLVIIGPSGAIKANGADGAAATGSTPNNSAGGGGGAGGTIQITADTIVEASGSLIQATGGAGGMGGGTGGSGAAGGSGGTAGCNVGSTGNSPTNGGGGGGGGGGGLILRRTDTDNVFRGTWSSSTTYSNGDVVIYNGLSYVSIQLGSNQQPDTQTSYWTVMGNSGFNALVASVSESPGVNCASGGLKVTSGLDNGDGGGTARDGTLQSGEVDATSYVCHGADGVNGDDGFDGLVATTSEAPGVNCATGGRKVESGLDDGLPSGTARNGALEAGEVDATTYVCHGATGATGATGAAGPIGITWLGQWDDSTSYQERDAVHYAGSAWYCVNAPCDDAPAPGDGYWDFIANADGNVVVPSSMNVESELADTWVPVVLWALALWICLRRAKGAAAFGALLGLVNEIVEPMPGSLPGYMLLFILLLSLEAIVGDRLWQRWLKRGDPTQGDDT